ncbi:MAG: hypothetical protein HYT70_02460 [Candidatus Aenigmarchaeota archaeon]|nr:hypothetical protein [Candidatus Aenigmarchaeota archaeon]
MQKVRLKGSEAEEKAGGVEMDSKLIQKWKNAGIRPSNLEFFTNRPDLVVGKIPNQDAEVEYVCPSCKFYEMKSVKMEKGIAKSGKVSRKFDRPEFSCSKCNSVIKVTALKKK